MSRSERELLKNNPSRLPQIIIRFRRAEVQHKIDQPVGRLVPHDVHRILQLQVDASVVNDDALAPLQGRSPQVVRHVFVVLHRRQVRLALQYLAAATVHDVGQVVRGEARPVDGDGRRVRHHVELQAVEERRQVAQPVPQAPDEAGVGFRHEFQFDLEVVVHVHVLVNPCNFNAVCRN